MVMMVMMVVLAGLTVEVDDAAYDEKQGPAHIKRPEMLDVFIANEQEDIGCQAHHHSYHGNVLIGIHFFKIIDLGKFHNVGFDY
jgi:hypothetical protein